LEGQQRTKSARMSFNLYGPKLFGRCGTELADCCYLPLMWEPAPGLCCNGRGLRAMPGHGRQPFTRDPFEVAGGWDAVKNACSWAAHSLPSEILTSTTLEKHAGPLATCMAEGARDLQGFPQLPDAVAGRVLQPGTRCCRGMKSAKTASHCRRIISARRA